MWVQLMISKMKNIIVRTLSVSLNCANSKKIIIKCVLFYECLIFTRNTALVEFKGFSGIERNIYFDAHEHVL